jgi:hypothetical protein
MTDHLNVDPVMLDVIADRLMQTGDNIDTTGTSAPPRPDAGEATPMVSDMLVRLCAGAARLAADIRALGDRVAEAGRLYVSEDIAAGQDLHEVN